MYVLVHSEAYVISTVCAAQTDRVGQTELVGRNSVAQRQLLVCVGDITSSLQRVGFLPEKGPEVQVSWVTLETAEVQSDIDWKVLTFNPPPGQENDQYRKDKIC